MKIDAINKPQRPIPSGRISLKGALVYSISLFAVGIIIAFAINLLLGIIALSSSLLMIYYARDLKERNLSTSRDHQGFTFFEQDIVSADLKQMLEDVDAVIHLAAQAGVRASWGRNFEIYTHNNLMSTQVILEAVKELGAEKYLEKVNKPLTVEQKQNKAKSIEPKIKRIIQALDKKGCWLVKNKITSKTFVRNMSSLCQYLELLK